MLLGAKRQGNLVVVGCEMTRLANRGETTRGKRLGAKRLVTIRMMILSTTFY